MAQSCFENKRYKMMKVKEGVTEQHKEDNQMEWVQRIGNIEARARETILVELIYI